MYSNHKPADTLTHNGHVWPPQEAPVSLWSFLINLSLLFCHAAGVAARTAFTQAGQVQKIPQPSPHPQKKSLQMINPGDGHQLIDTTLIGTAN